MGQTLSHGVYLPAEGERNCYSGLASNWQILNTAVGNIAEKAPLVHTHGNITNDGKVGTTANLPLITGTGGAVQAGAFGNQANTFCEGNDSRLSDARTPVAHTHTKSDVTDLFNSANTWTGDNTFSGSNSFNSGLTINNAASLNVVLQNAVKGNVSTAGDFAIFIKDKVNGNAATSLLAVYRGGQDSGGSYAQITIDTKGNDNNRYNNSILFRINPADNSNNAVFIPQRDKTIDLGSSSYQWNNAYIKSLTINGVACGDILTHNANEFANDADVVHVKGSDDIIDSKTFISLYTQSGGPSLWMKNTSFTMGTAPTTNRYSGIWVQDNNGTDTAYIVHQANKNNSQNLKFSVSNTDGTTVYQNALTFQGRLDGTFNFYSDNPANLGTSTNKWTTLNGVNPGALSLPGTGGFTDIKGDITNLSGGDNTFTAPYDGWVCVRSTNATVIHIINTVWAVSQSATRSNAGTLCCLCPVMSGYSFKVIVNATSLEYAYIHPCKGNVY